MKISPLISLPIIGILLVIAGIRNEPAGALADFKDLRAGVGVETTAKAVYVETHTSGKAFERKKPTKFCPRYEFVTKDGTTGFVDTPFRCVREEKPVTAFADITVIYDPADTSIAFDNSPESFKYAQGEVYVVYWMFAAGIGCLGGAVWIIVRRRKAAAAVLKDKARL